MLISIWLKIKKIINSISKEWINNILSKSEVSGKIKNIREEKKNYYVITSTYSNNKNKEFKEFKEKVFTILEKAGWKGKRKDLIIEDDNLFSGSMESSISIETSSTDRSFRG